MEYDIGSPLLFDGAGMGHFRLIYESHKSSDGNTAGRGVKIFEYVPGALIRVRADPNQSVGALLNMTSNQEQTFAYINEATLRGDSYEMRVPYSTESRYDTRALGLYQIFSVNETGVQKMQEFRRERARCHRGPNFRSRSSVNKPAETDLLRKKE